MKNGNCKIIVRGLRAGASVVDGSKVQIPFEQMVYGVSWSSADCYQNEKKNNSLTGDGVASENTGYET